MSAGLTDFQKQLCNRLQRGLPLCGRPYAEIAKALNSTEDEVLEQTRQLKEAGIIRRIAAVLNHRALGYSGTLVTAHVPDEQLPPATAAINALPGVSHNYLRQHRFNMWFTLQEDSPEQIRRTLSQLQAKLGVEFHSLPVTRIFKLDVRFDAESDDDVLLQDVERPPRAKPVELTDVQRLALSHLQPGLDVTPRPFDKVRPQDMTEADLFARLTELLKADVIRRIAGVLNHHKLGFNANIMFAGEVAPEHIVEAGRWLAHSGTVSHCYERETFPGWPYNLFAMLHGRTMAQIQHTLDNFSATGHVRSFELLPTQAELKKQPVCVSFDT
ncbi:MAG: siroheme decarboxylase subunit beta [Planctomycetota bacterium]